jgi:polysaccharide deacetylase family protein (PEP-CTERM system associated)
MAKCAEIENCLSIDVESFVEGNLESFPIPSKYVDKAAQDYEIEKNSDVFLEFLDELQIRATFFILGRVARDLPQVVRRVADARNEIACHGDEHLRIFNLQPQQFRESLLSAKKSLEDTSGSRVFGFRAPDFSITQASIWALDVLREAGFVYDSSIYPIDMHDVYGINDAETSIHKLPNGLIEWPLSTMDILGKRLPFGGGGYFRLFPLAFTRRCIRTMNQRGRPCMLYIHPYEVGPIIPRIEELSAYRRFRHYHNCHTGRTRLKKLLRAFKFSTAIQILDKKETIELCQTQSM